MNSVNLIGNLARDPDIRYSGKGKDELCIARFTLAVNRPGSEEADFIGCVAFGKSAELIEKYVFKGKKVGITGHIQTGSYENKDGQKVYTTDIVVDRIEFLSPAASEGSQEEDSRNSKSSNRNGSNRR